MTPRPPGARLRIPQDGPAERGPAVSCRVVLGSGGAACKSGRVRARGTVRLPCVCIKHHPSGRHRTPKRCGPGRPRGAALGTMMGPPPRLASADADADAASLHAQISALKVMRRRLRAFRTRKRQRVEEPEDDVSMITAETVKELSLIHISEPTRPY